MADAGAGRRAPRITRRGLLGGAAVGAGTAGAGFLGGHAYADQDPAAGVRTEPVRRYVPFAGPHQTGITTHPVPALGLMAAFTCVAGGRDDLRTCLAELTDEIRRLMAGAQIEQRPPAYPPVDSGILGAQAPRRQPVGGGQRGRLAVRRPLRSGRSASARAGADAVPGQRPARPRPFARRPAAHRRGRACRHHSVRAAPADAAYAGVAGAEVDGRRLHPRHHPDQRPRATTQPEPRAT